MNPRWKTVLLAVGAWVVLIGVPWLVYRTLVAISAAFEGGVR